MKNILKRLKRLEREDYMPSVTCYVVKKTFSGSDANDKLKSPGYVLVEDFDREKVLSFRTTLENNNGIGTLPAGCVIASQAEEGSWYRNYYKWAGREQLKQI